MNIRDLAKRAGVSRTTVSRALNNAPDVSSATKERIRKLAEELGYQANPMVTALMASVRRKRIRENRSILAIVPPPFQKSKWGTGHYAHQLYRNGVETRARHLGFQVEEFSVSHCGNSYQQLSRMLYHRGIHAVLIPSIDTVGYPEDYQYDLDWDRFFVAGIGYSISKPTGADRAVMSHYGSASLALQEIKKRGYRRIGFGTRKSISARIADRWLAAYLIFQKNHPHLSDLPYFEFEYGEGEEDKFDRWFDTYRPDAILGERYFMKLMEKRGVRIPWDAAFALMDWLPCFPDSLEKAGIDQRFESVGAAAVDMIAGKINRGERGLSPHPSVLKILGQWVEGASLPSRNE